MKKSDKFDDRPEQAIRLSLAREASGFKTPKEAATFHGWKYETYIQHEQGTRGITRAARRYSKAFRVPLIWLLEGDGPGPSKERIEAAQQLSPDDVRDIEETLDDMRKTLMERRIQSLQT